MEATVKQYIEEYNILTGAGSVVLAVSGGADSMALAHFMAKNYPQFDYIVAHVNHRLRPEAGAEEAMVGKFAAQLGLSFISVDIDVALVANTRKIGIEEAGRQVRYEFFRGLNRDIILTAHHKDDNAETVLAHIIRGAGIKGLRGILPLDNGIGRPLLGVTKEELVNYCHSNAIDFAEDATNLDTTYRRNKIRHEVIPLLAEINPNIVDTLCRLGNIAVGDDEALEYYTLSNYAALVKWENNKLTIGNKVLSTLPPGIRRRIVLKMAEEIDCPLDYRGTQQVLSLKTGKKYFWGEGGAAEQNGRSLLLYLEDDTYTPRWWVSLESRGITRVPHCKMDVEIVENPTAHPNKNTLCIVDRDIIAQGLTMRNRREGDWFSLPKGGRKKLSDYFIDEKIPGEERDTIPLLAVGSQILWIVGHRICVPGDSGDTAISLKKY